jgi:hypothetical protein
MTVTSALARGRRAAEALMADTCTIRRRTGQTTDPLTGQVTPVWTSVYSGVCRVQQARTQGARTDAGETSVMLMRQELHLPVSTSADVRRGDEVTITASVNDADLVGRVYLVRDEAAKSLATARRLGIEETT